MEKNEVIENSIAHQKISNGISVTRILTMFWVVSVNYFQIIFSNFYNQSYSYSIEKSKNFVELINNQGILEKIFLPFFYSGWAAIVIFLIISGFSLWFSSLVRKKFKLGNYAVGRFNNIYLSYLIAVVITILGNYFLRQRVPELYDFSALILGVSKMVPSAFVYNGPFWSMTILLLCYLFFPIFPLLYKKMKIWGILLFGSISFGLLFLWRTLYFSIPASTSSNSILSALYPLLPFWSFFCLGIILCHLVYKYSTTNNKKINLKLINYLMFPLFIVAGIFFLYKFAYVFPSQNPEIAWRTNPYLISLCGLFIFFSIGYLLPIKLYKPLRWLSRGTLGVFLYHYLLFPFVAPYIKPPFFTSHISIALIIFYLILLIIFSLFQHFLDKTIIKYSRKATEKEYEIIA